MGWFTRTFTYSVGKKLIMSLTGLFLFIFLIVHLAGNLFLFANDNGESFNHYSHVMTSNPIVLVLEVVLFAGFILHIVDGIIVWLQNRRARPQGYVMDKQSPNTFWTARNMIISGAIVLLFLLIHLKTFFVPYRIEKSVPDLFALTREAFQNPFYSGFYVFAMILLALHLHHGFASAFQTIGVRHPKYYPPLRVLGIVLSVLICAGFAAMPLYFLLFY